MKKISLEKVFLVLAGLIAIIVGASLLFDPVDFERSAGIAGIDDVNLLSELRTPGAMILVIGCFIVFTGLNGKMEYVRFLLVTAFYLAYGMARLYAMGVDGLPHTTLIIATVIEWLFGLIAAGVVLRRRKQWWSQSWFTTVISGLPGF